MKQKAFTRKNERMYRKMKKKIWTGAILVLLFIAAMGVTVSADNPAMKNKKWVTGQGGAYIDTDKDGKKDSYQSYGTSYYKIQIPKQGYIVVDVKTSKIPGKEEYDAYMGEGDGLEEEDDASTILYLLNSKKKKVGSCSNFFSGKNKMVFTAAVKKGTYYISAEGDQQYKIRYTFTPVAKVSKAGKSLKKAVNLKKGATVRNLLYGDKDQYYKFTVKEKTKITLSFNAKVRGGLLDSMGIELLIKKGGSYQQVDEKGKTVSKNNSVYWEMKGKDKLTATLPEGTYYIRAFTWEGMSGYYTMRWK